jgi:hypothetical protein
MQCFWYRPKESQLTELPRVSSTNCGEYAKRVPSHGCSNTTGLVWKVPSKACCCSSMWPLLTCRCPLLVSCQLEQPQTMETTRSHLLQLAATNPQVCATANRLQAGMEQLLNISRLNAKPDLSYGCFKHAVGARCCCCPPVYVHCWRAVAVLQQLRRLVRQRASLQQQQQQQLS